MTTQIKPAMEDLLNMQFDDKLKFEIPHFDSYPEMLPFIGKKWGEIKKTLIIGESHYLPFHEIKSDFDYKANWYSGNSNGLSQYHKFYIQTRLNPWKADVGPRNQKPLMMYYNIRRALKEIIDDEYVFQYFSYCNYFQKPADVAELIGENRSIEPEKIDKDMAFQILQKVVEIIRPDLIIFASRKAFNAFNEKKHSNKHCFYGIKVDSVPHAGQPWWNRSSKSYGNRTGKQKFIDLVKEAV